MKDAPRTYGCQKECSVSQSRGPKVEILVNPCILQFGPEQREPLLPRASVYRWTDNKQAAYHQLI